MNVGQELLNVPMGKMIASMATSIADAQWQLDKSSMVVSELMSGNRILRDLETGDIKKYEVDDTTGRVKTGVDGEKIPLTVDSRIQFGYTYEPVKDSTGKDVLDGNKKPVYKRVPQKVSMMELGFTPNFYQFVDTIIEVKIAIKVTSESEYAYGMSHQTTNQNQSSTRSRGGYYWWNYRSNNSTTTYNTNTTQVDASYTNKYNYSIDGSSLLRTKLSPVPPPAILEERIREVMESEKNFVAKIDSGKAILESDRKK